MNGLPCFCLLFEDIALMFQFFGISLVYHIFTAGKLDFTEVYDIISAVYYQVYLCSFVKCNENF